MLAVDARRLGRVYRSRSRSTETVALDDVNLSVDEGEIHGLLGPNGAGKTTLVKVLATVLTPTAGTASVLGHDVVAAPKQVRAKVGVVFGGERGLYTRVSARRNLAFWAALYRLDGATARRRCAQLLERVGLADHADQPVEEYSRGMKQRLHLARGLLHDPRVLFLDEPTSGLDPVGAHAFRDLVRELRGEGRSVFLTTHDMAEAEALCDRVSLIDHGRLVLTEPVREVASYLGTRECVDFSGTDAALVEQVRALPFVASVEDGDGQGSAWRVFPHSAADTQALLRWLIDHDILSARRGEPTLEEVYLRVVGTRGLTL
jgi:ABC-2 type transport system ATP-binding protein